MPDEVAALRAENGRLREANERLRMLLEDKDAKIADLEKRLARVERLLSRNSGNSGMPPGNDDLPGKTPPEPKPRRGGGRKPGKQRGAPGAHLEWNEHPDGTRDVFPAGGCACGADLSGAADLGVRYSHQVTDLPEAAATTVQYDRHEVECGCGRRHVADPPPEAAGAPGTVTYGLNFQAWCVFLMVMHHVPVERCADILESMSGTRPSDGWVHGLLGRAAKAVAAANKTIRALIILARVICGDETPHPGRPRPEVREEEVPAGRLHQPAHLLLPRRPGPALLQELHLQRPARQRGRARPVPELRAPRGALLYRLLSGRRMEEMSSDLMPYRRPKG